MNIAAERPQQPHRAPRRDALPWLDAALPHLAAGAIAASWLAAVVIAESAEGSNLLETAVRPPLYYVAHGAALGCALLAGLLAVLAGRAAMLSPGTRVAFCVLFAGAILHALAAYDVRELLSTRVLGATGPFVWLSLILVAAGTETRIWRSVDPLVRGLSFLTAGAALLTLVEDESAYLAGLSRSTQYAGMLFWLCSWTLLKAAYGRAGERLLAMFPYFTLLAVAVHSQARSWTALALLLGLAFLILHARARGTPAALVRNAAALAALAVAAAAVLSFTTPMADSIEGLRERLADDTRSSQYAEFFADVAPGELILGRGPKGTWFWSVGGDFQFFDNGFLWTLFIGGLPALLPYLVIVFGPLVRLAPWLPKGPGAVPVVVLLFWAAALAGLSTFTLPSLGLAGYLTSLCAGHCHRLALEARLARMRPRTAPAAAAAAHPISA